MSESQIRILLVDDESSVVNALRRSLRREGYQIFTTTSPEDAMKTIGEERIDIVVSDHLMPEMTGLELFTMISRLHPHVFRIVLTGQADVDMAIRAINQGQVQRFMTKPWDDDELKHILQQAAREITLRRRQEDVANTAPRRPEPSPGTMPSPSKASIFRDKAGAIVIDELAS